MPVLDTVWTREEAQAQKRGRLVIYLGAAPGVGKTFAMLSEGQRAKARGTDVVVGVIADLRAPADDRDARGARDASRRSSSSTAAAFDEMDVERLIARAPESR